MNKFLSIILSFCIFSFVKAETRNDVYKFLSLPNSAFVSAMGGANVSTYNSDLNLAFQNPALLTPDLNTSFAINYTNYISDVNYGSLAYSGAIDSLQSWAIGLFYVNYGSFEAYTEDDVYDGTFSASDICLSLNYSHQLFENVNGGFALKPIYSHIENYNSFGIAFDFGLGYHNEKHKLGIGLTAKNIGIQLKGYYSDEKTQHRETLPWEIQAGITKGLAHAPFRFSLTFVNINNWDINYYKYQKKSSTFTTTSSESEDIGWGDMLFRHLLLGVEFIPSKNFNIQLAYNHRRNREYMLDGTNSFNGFSLGTNFNLYKFKLGVSYAQYAASGNTLNISIQSSLKSFK